MSDDTQILPDLDTVVLEALSLFEKAPPPAFPDIKFEKPLIIGSGNAYWIGRILFEDKQALFANESDFENILKANVDIDGAIIISASGSKSSTEIAQTLEKRGLKTILLTTEKGSPTGQILQEENVYLFPKKTEPYSYNVSPYLGMLLSHFSTKVGDIKDIIDTLEEKLPENLKQFDAFVLLLPAKFHLLKGVFATKFEELFGSRVRVRAYTFNEFKHAKSIVPNENELFVTFGYPEFDFKTRESDEIYSLPIPENADYPLLMSLGYYFIGRIQKVHPPYFKTNVKGYLEKSKSWFDDKPKPI
ncbi:MAG: hypothetical protein WDZ64_00940 [Parcubacteria group bacterium]